jgi:hypothetical protein
VFSRFNKIVAAGSSYVCRIRDNSECEIRLRSKRSTLEKRPIRNPRIDVHAEAGSPDRAIASIMQGGMMHCSSSRSLDTKG